MAIGVALLTFGSATTADDVPEYLRSVRHGADIPDQVLHEFQRRYRLIGHSPLVAITERQASALERVLCHRHGAQTFVVRAGMLHSAPRIDTAADDLIAAGADQLVGIILSPQYSPILMAGYNRALEAAAERHGVAVSLAGPWHGDGDFIESMARLLTQALDEFPEAARRLVPVILTAHSLPRAVVDRDPEYLGQLHETAADIARAAHLDGSRWQFAYQSAGHTQEEWLTPDFKDLLPQLAQDGHTDVLVVPTQFVADHLEVLYDIDIAGGEEATERGMRLHRSRMPNVDERFIGALATVVESHLTAASAAV